MLTGGFEPPNSGNAHSQTPYQQVCKRFRQTGDNICRRIRFAVNILTACFDLLHTRAYTLGRIRTCEAQWRKILSLMFLVNCCKLTNKVTVLPNTSSGTRTHEAYAAHLKCAPFDHSGMLVFPCSQFLVLGLEPKTFGS